MSIHEYLSKLWKVVNEFVKTRIILEVSKVVKVLIDH